MAVDTHHPQYAADAWKKIRDICEAEDVDEYIVPINPLDRSPENRARNKQFRERAVFTAIAGFTVAGMNGLLFRDWPKLIVPDFLQYMAKDCTGTGISLYQQSQNVASDLITLGRAGLWVDFPKTPSGGVSVAEMDRYRAKIHSFAPEQIINWAEREIDGTPILSLVVLHETSYEQVPGEYELVEVQNIIELYLDDAGVYNVRRWRKTEDDKEFQPGEAVQPRRYDGTTWNRVLFTFVGAKDNTTSVDRAPMRDIVRLNIGHYNNSAVYEDSVFICGQPQPWMSGIDVSLAQLMRESGVYWGSNQLLPVPEGQQVGLIQAQPNTIARQAMLDKLDQAIGLGAMYITPGSAVKTATQAAGEQQTQHSVLSLIASNLSEAYTASLQTAWQFYSGEETEIEYTVNQDFVEVTATAADLKSVVESWLQGGVPWSDAWAWQQKHGFGSMEKTAEEAREEIVNGGPGIPDLSGGDE